MPDEPQPDENGVLIEPAEADVSMMPRTSVAKPDGELRARARETAERIGRRRFGGSGGL